jgi:ubiquinone/menaquinone biosynthesis C-methylase UbiE
MTEAIDFGYPWWLSYGHLVVAVPAAAVLLFGYARKWSRTPMLLWSVVLLWSTTALFVARFVLNVNGRASLPTQSFIPSGRGRVLDMGAGTGRSSIMVLESRPQATLVALDLFADSYKEHFGTKISPQARLFANLKAAHVENRATIKVGDMRKLPFEAAEFDAIVSSYAIDHLSRAGVEQSLREAARVVKPGGEFLLILIAKDPWLEFAFGPLMLHAGIHGVEWWTSHLKEARFQVIEQGIRPATLFLLSRSVS